MTAELVGNLICPNILTVDLIGYKFELIPVLSNKIEHISISKQVREDRVDLFKSTIGSGQGGSKATINIGGDRETHMDLIDKSQMI